MAQREYKEKPVNRLFEHFLKLLRSRLKDSQRFFFLSVIVGLSCGLVAVAFHLAIRGIGDLVLRFPKSTEASLVTLIVLPLVPALGGLLVGIGMARWSPNARGSGIPQVKAAFYNKFGLIRFRDAVYRFLFTTLSIGSGNSLGREGPTVHLYAAIGSTIGQWFGLPKARIQAMVPVGMGAGIAAGFNTPLAAITFVFEKLLDDFSSKALGGILVAVIIASVVSRAILGENPAFEVESYSFESYSWVLLSIVIGLLAAILVRSFFPYYLVGGITSKPHVCLLG
ncbi:MAG: chloride channel protein [Opitutales bacterium]|nr:chloride channel protein [Opitutales bacterium]